MVSSTAMDAEGWSGFLGRKWAVNWPRTDRTFDGLSERMERLAEGEPFGSVLDIGCGAGQTTLNLAARHPKVAFTGIDVCPELVAAARERAQSLANVRFEVGDAAHWTSQFGARFDLLIARHTVMFFDDPPQALTHLAELAADGARIVFTCFRSNTDNGWIADILKELPGDPVPRVASGKPSPLAFADAKWVEGLLRQSGWAEVVAEPVDYRMIVGEGDDPIGAAVSYLMEIGPASFAAATLGADDLAGFKARMADMLHQYLDDGRVGLPAGTWIYSARKA